MPTRIALDRFNAARCRGKAASRCAPALLAGMAVLAGCSSTQSVSTSAGSPPGGGAGPVVHTIDPTLAVATFDAAWRLVYESHFDPEFNGVDWPAVRDELRPQVEMMNDEDELRGVINDMLGRLGQSHFALLPREAVDRLEDAGDEDSAATNDAHAPSDDGAESSDASNAAASPVDEAQESDDSNREGDLGLKVAIIDSEVVVTWVDDAGPAALAGVHSGWVIETINQKALSPRLEALANLADDKMANYHAMQVIMHQLGGKPGTTVDLVFRDDIDATVPLVLKRRVRPGEMVQFGNLPPMNANLEHERLVAESGAEVGVIRFSIWMLPLNKPFASAVDDLRDADGIVLDLRGNPGGVGGMAMGIAGHFVSESSILGTMKTRSGELKFNVSPRRVNAAGERVDPYTGPLAILVDRYTASTSEIFSAGMQSIGRARVFGETSAGAALPAQMNRLPNGDVLLHAFADFILPTGESVEGTGVVPDTAIVLSREDLIGGGDPVLDAAVAWIAAQTPLESAAAVLAK